MAIAPSRLGRLIADEWRSEETLVRKLRESGLVKRSVSDSQIKDTFNRAREEHARIDEGMRMFNSPNERVRVFLGPLLTRKGRRWAVPLTSLAPPWWKFWEPR
jgi:hypothetical protein